MATEEITISELELADEVLADMTLPVDTATETRAVTLKQLRAWLGSSLPTGFIIPAVGKISDERFTLLDGKTLSREGTYEAFCNKVVSEVQAGNWFACSEDEYNSDISTYGQCGKFVVSNDYIRIPTITRFIGATVTLSEIGTTYKESLPNIKGQLGNLGNTGGAIANGAFQLDYNHGDVDYSNVKGFVASFNASRSSSAYQDGAKVQPDHTKYPYYMVISTEGQTAKVGIDINKVYEDLNIKANSDLSNVSANIDYVVESGTNGNYWYRKYKSGWLEQGAIADTMEGVSGNETKSFNFLKPFKYENGYMFFITSFGTDDDRTGPNITLTVRATTYFSANNQGYDTARQRDFNWIACGQGA